MRIALVIVIVALALSVTLNIFMSLQIDKEIDNVNSYGSSAFILSNQLMFDGLREKRIDIYTLKPEPPKSFRVKDYTVRILPMVIVLGKNNTGAGNFVNHNHGSVGMLACHLWSEEREVARELIRLLSKTPFGTQYVAELISEKGEGHEDVKRYMESESLLYEDRRRCYGEYAELGWTLQSE